MVSQVKATKNAGAGWSDERVRGEGWRGEGRASRGCTLEQLLSSVSRPVTRARINDQHMRVVNVAIKYSHRADSASIPPKDTNHSRILGAQSITAQSRLNEIGFK
jgi:hypothetical protein